MKKNSVIKLLRAGYSVKEIALIGKCALTTVIRQAKKSKIKTCLKCRLNKKEYCCRCLSWKKALAFHRQTCHGAHLCQSCFVEFQTVKELRSFLHQHCAAVRNSSKNSSRMWRKSNPKKSNARIYNYVKTMKIGVIMALGGECQSQQILGIPCCTPNRVPTIHHINGDGAEHRAAYNNIHGNSHIYYSVKRILKKGFDVDPSGRVWHREDFGLLCDHCQQHERKLRNQKLKENQNEITES